MTATVLPFPVRIPFVEGLGLTLHRFDGGQAELRLDVAPAHHNSFAVAHGGVLMTLLDVAMAHAARSVHRDQPDGGPGAVTIEMKTSFMQPAQGALVATGRVLHRTVTLAFCEAEVRHADGGLCAHATGTFKLLRALPTGGRQTHPLQRPEG